MTAKNENKTELEKRIETMRTLERAFSVIGETKRAQDMRNRYQDLEAILKHLEIEDDQS